MLVTGATGFLGAHLAHALLRAGYRVKALRRANSSLRRVAQIADQISWYEVDSAAGAAKADEPDAASAARMAQFFAGVDCVIHCAASYGRQGESVPDLVRTNLLFGLAVLNAALTAKVPLFLHTDSALPKFSKPYALSKAQFAEWGQYFAQNGQIRFVNIRLEHMFGPGDDSVKFTHSVIQACLKNVPALALTEGLQQRDFIYIDDVVAAYLLLLEQQSRPGVGPGHIEIALGSGQTVSIRALVEMIHAMAQSKTRLDFGAVPMAATEVLYSCADISGMQGMGWQPQTGLREGLQRTIDSLKNA